MWLTWVVVLSLVVYRITRFLIDDDLINEPRAWLQRTIAGGVRGRALRIKLLELMQCPYCVSVWVGAGVVLLASILSTVPYPVLTWGAACGGCMVVWTVVETE